MIHGEERKQILAIPGKLTSVTDPLGRPHRLDEAAETANSRVEERNASERSHHGDLGIESEKSITTLGEISDQEARGDRKHRSVRARNDELDRISSLNS